MPTEYLFVTTLVVVAGIAGGWLLRGWLGGRDGGTTGGLSEEYFRGLNFLLNEEPDKALEVFIRMVEVDSETVETHFALGSMFRRRGEVERAIRIHQNLIARPNLSRAHRMQALYELGDDYMRAGLFDRAESLFAELAQSGTYVAPALRQLMTIYEQQNDWEQAVAAAQRLELVEGRSQQRTIAHYWCEMAELAEAAGHQRRAAQLARKAQSSDTRSVRADMLAARTYAGEGDPAAAIRAYQRIIENDPVFAGEVLSDLEDCYGQLDDTAAFDRYLANLRDSQAATIPAVAMAAFQEPKLRSHEILPFIERYLETRGRGLARLLERLTGQRSLDPQLELDSARDLVRALLEDHPRYLCRECGLAANTLYWQCPSCRGWDTIKPHVELPYAPSASALPEGTGKR